MSTHYTTIIEEGIVPNKYTTGEVSFKKRTSDIQPRNTAIKEVAFEPGSRNNWHTNTALQLLVATEGVGYFQERGNPIRLICKGEVLTILPGVEHWYGATPDNRFSHIAIITEIDKGIGTWMEQVTDEEYNSFTK
ncbi:cupin domain-containing protein [Flavobacterium sp. LS1R49]|uniref:Cupin domain-containing protein n=1 Tax=Flavobacterium shii TaxID=2987687 RepID=A0A9X2ZDX5_9FLAO|nr:cupin domain-containing protein [Flavobacterium shii]MCV9927051.1 cupin domain-containing protein [Flavobacterium shii]